MPTHSLAAPTASRSTPSSAPPFAATPPVRSPRLGPVPESGPPDHRWADAEVVRRIAQGDATALEELHERYAATLLRFLFARMGRAGFKTRLDCVGIRAGGGFQRLWQIVHDRSGLPMPPD